MSLVEASLASSAVKFAPWAPSWEDGIEVGSGGHVTPVVSQRRDFTETERELLHRGVELIIGVKESQELEQPDPSDVALSPSSPHSTAHYIVRRVPGPSETLTLRKEGEGGCALDAERQVATAKALWKITSANCSIGECSLITNAKRSTFVLLRDGFEEAAIYYRKAPGNTNLRFFDVVIPALQRETGKRVEIRYDGANSYLLAQATAETMPSDCVKLSVREPQLKDQRWVLMFNGRVKRSSTRNFILVHHSQPAREILLCGKSGHKEFVFDINWPLSVLQGFGVYLTLFSKPKPN